jgi:hypothetical protein
MSRAVGWTGGQAEPSDWLRARCGTSVRLSSRPAPTPITLKRQVVILGIQRLGKVIEAFLALGSGSSRSDLARR